MPGHLSELPLTGVCVVIPTREGLPQQASNCLQDLLVLGARRIVLAGCADIALARNLLITRALDTRVDGEHTLLLLDDDILYDRATIQLLVERSRAAKATVSAVYATNDGHVAARPYGGRWLTGLGCLAVPMSVMIRAASNLLRLKSARGQDLYPFCQSRYLANGDRFLGPCWLSEDQWFCRSLGGVEIAPLKVQHFKRMALVPDDATMQRLFDPASDDATDHQAAPTPEV